MSISYRFSNLCGSVFRGGNLVYTPDGNSLLSPVGNRVTVFDLIRHTSYTLPCENRKDVVRMAMSNDGRILVTVDEDGHALFINFARRSVMHRFHFRERVLAMAFSPDDELLAVATGKTVRTWQTPVMEKLVAPLALHRTYTGHFDDINSVSWSGDGLYLITASRDLTARIYTRNFVKGYVPTTLGGHRGEVVSADFLSEPGMAVTVTRDAAVFIWKWTPLSEIEGRPSDDEEDEVEEEEEEAEDDERGATFASRPDDDFEEEEEEDNAKKDIDFEEEDDEEEEEDNAKKDIDFEGEEEEEEEEDEEEIPEKEEEGVLSAGLKRPYRLFSKQSVAAVSKVDAEEAYLGVRASLRGRRSRERHSVRFSSRNGEWTLEKKHLFARGDARVRSACLHRVSGLLVAGFSDGVFGLYSVPDLSAVHSLSVSSGQVDAAAVNASGEWLALGCSALGQLLVWEWQSEQHVLKQQGHSYDVGCVAFGPDGHVVATGADDGKVKLWSTLSGFCFVTFAEHAAPVTGLAFMGGKGGRGQAVVSSSLDGTVRAFDLVRYRNFRTFSAPVSTQFLCVAVNPSSDLIAAGSNDPFHVYVWNVRNGELLDELAGHEGPVSCIQFAPARDERLASGSWDGTIRLWGLYGGGGASESLGHSGDVLGLAWRPDARQIAAASRDGQVYLWNAERGTEEGILDARRDAAVKSRHGVDGRTLPDAETYFTSLSYSPDGSQLLGAGRSPFLCLYALGGSSGGVLVRRWQMSHNRSIPGIQLRLRQNEVADDGTPWLELGDRPQAPAAGSRSIDAGERTTAPELRARGVAFSPTGRAFGAACTEGLLLYTLDDLELFDPHDLDLDVTPDAVALYTRQGKWSHALIAALRLNEETAIRAVRQAVPLQDIPLVASSIPVHYVPRLLSVLAADLDTETAWEAALRFALALLEAHAIALRARPSSAAAPVRDITRAIARQRAKLAHLVRENAATLDFLHNVAHAPHNPLKALLEPKTEY